MQKKVNTPALHRQIESGKGLKYHLTALFYSSECTVLALSFFCLQEPAEGSLNDSVRSGIAFFLYYCMEYSFLLNTQNVSHLIDAEELQFPEAGNQILQHEVRNWTNKLVLLLAYF